MGTNGMNDAIDNVHPCGKKGTSSWGARDFSSRIDDFNPEPIIQASLTKMGSGSANFQTTSDFSSVFTFTEDAAASTALFPSYSVGFEVSGILSCGGKSTGGSVDGCTDSNANKGYFQVAQARDCASAIANGDAGSIGTSSLNDQMWLTWEYNGGASTPKSITAIDTSVHGDSDLPRSGTLSETIIGKTVVFYCTGNNGDAATGAPCACGVIGNTRVKAPAPTPSGGPADSVSIGPDAFEYSEKGGSAFSLADANIARRRHLADTSHVALDLECGTQCGAIKDLLAPANCPLLKRKLAELTPPIEAQCAEAVRSFTEAPTPSPTAAPTKADWHPDAPSMSGTGVTSYSVQYGTLVQQSALEKKYEHAAIALGVFSAVLLLLVIFLVMRIPSSKRSGDGPVTASQLEPTLQGTYEEQSAEHYEV